MLFCSLQYNKPQGPDPVPSRSKGAGGCQPQTLAGSSASDQITCRGMGPSYLKDAAIIRCSSLHPLPRSLGSLCAGVRGGHPTRTPGCSGIALACAHIHVPRSCLFGGVCVRNRFLPIQILLSLGFKKCYTKHF